MRTSTPVIEVKNIIEGILNNNNHTPENEKQELLTLLNTILEQNYLQFNDQLYKQNKGLAMEAPTRREQQHGRGNHIHKNNKTYKEEPGQVQKMNYIDWMSG
jgi:hypothetical protein